MWSRFKLFSMAAGLLLLASCQTNPAKLGPDGTRGSEYTLEQVPALLDKAAEAETEERAKLLLEATEILLFHGETDWARNIITGIASDTLSDNTYVRYQLLASRVAIENGSHLAAERHLTTQRLQDILPELPAPLAIAVHQQKAQVFESIGDYHSSVRERLLLDELLAVSATKEDARNLNQDALWRTLMQLSYDDLSRLEQQAKDATAAGWFNLARLSKNHQGNLRQQLAMVDEWARNWPEHPASLRLPADLHLLRELVENQPQKVALLLPLTGPLTQPSAAIRDGFMAAYYNASQHSEQLPDVRIYDTNTMDINAAYDQALLDGAEAVVGPLEQKSITELALRPELPVPTLALNYADTPFADLQQLYQFGLPVEAEAQQVAQRAWQDGKRRALILAPSSTWGDRSVHSFWQEWRELGGEVTRDYRFGDDNDYSAVISSALHVTNSQERAKQMREILGRSIEFEPRRRKDVDMIFLVAQTPQARQIKPTLAFHYGGNIPVYATSHVYSDDDSKANQDMNGIRFTTLPWFFEEKAPERRALQRYANTAASYQRLYALGVDAYYLYPRLRQLRDVTGARYYGYTGALSLSEDGKIQRQQIWAQFVGGQARAMTKLQEDERKL